MFTQVKTAIRSCLKLLGISYDVYYVYEFDLGTVRQRLEGKLAPCYSQGPIDALAVRQASAPLIREQAWYGGDDALGFAIFRDKEPVCVQWIWYGERYRRERAFWPLGEREAKSVQLVTAPSERGRGLATALKRLSAEELAQRGFERIYSRIWWSNAQSIRVSEKAGWQLRARVALLRWGKGDRSLKVVINTGPLSGAPRVVVSVVNTTHT